MDANIIFVALIIIIFLYIIQKYPILVIVSILVYIGYIIFKTRFINPKDCINYCVNKITETFNTPYNTGDNHIDTNINSLSVEACGLNVLPLTSLNNSTVTLKYDIYYLNTSFSIGDKYITINEIVSHIPILLDYKLYFEQIIKFTLNCNSIDIIQKDFLANKLRYKMTLILTNAYTTIIDDIYAIHSYNELLKANSEFVDTLNIFTFLSLNDNDTHRFEILQTNIIELNKKLIQFIIDKVNNKSINNYNVTTTILPQYNDPEPQSANI